MRINIEASAEELAEIGISGTEQLPDMIINALDHRLDLPGYTVTVNEPSAIQTQLVEALEIGLSYVDDENSEKVIIAALSAAGAQP